MLVKISTIFLCFVRNILCYFIINLGTDYFTQAGLIWSVAHLTDIWPVYENNRAKFYIAATREVVQSGQLLSQFFNVLILANQAEGITLARAVSLTRQAM